MSLSRRSFLAACVGALGTLALGRAALAKKGPKRSKDGEYKIDVAGYVKGGGTATVSGNASITITAEVKDIENGRKGMVNATIRIVNDRFVGQGTVIGDPVKVIGRLDAPTATVPKGRVSGTFMTTTGKRFGRFVGELKP